MKFYIKQTVDQIVKNLPEMSVSIENKPGNGKQDEEDRKDPDEIIVDPGLNPHFIILTQEILFTNGPKNLPGTTIEVI